MLEHIVIPAMALDPAITPEPRRHLGPVRFGLGRHGFPVRKYWRI
jgi:hypothetical protein